jgi:PAS domain S-box-containing protein
VLDRNIPLMFHHIERRYEYFLPVTPPVEECLLVPFHIQGKAVGTIWAVAHSDRRKFDAEDMRQLISLSRFASSAHQVIESLDLLEKHAAALRQSEYSLHEMIDALPAAIYTTDVEGRLTHFNRACIELSGRTPVLGSDCWCVSWKLYRADGTPLPHDECPMAIALKEGRAVCDQMIILERPNGSRALIRPYPTLLRDCDGKIVGGINMLMDVTESSEAELARLAAIVESSDDAIVSKTLDGVITSWNRSAERMFGYTEAEAIGRHISLIIPAERRSEENEVLARLRRGEKIDHFETERQTKDGRRLNISLTVSPIKDRNGKIVGASKIARDITERKQTEKELRKAKREAEVASRAKDKFLATLSHELRTPLNAIIGWSYLMRESLEDVGFLKRALDVVDRNTKNLIELIADLLDVSRVVSGHLELDFAEIRFENLVSFAVDSARPQAEAKELDLTYESALDNEGAKVRGDEARLQQVVNNLLGNAIKFTPAHGVVTVRLSKTLDKVVLAVTDTGKGIAKEFMPRIFDPFSQAEPASGSRGLGLGLSICRNFVEAHCGSIRAHSDGPGRGAVFTVELPLIASARNVGAEHLVEESFSPTIDIMPNTRLQGVTVLAVDDNADAQDLLQTILERSGAVASVVGSGREALNVLRRLQPDVLLIDLAMPDMSGIELLNKIRALAPESGGITPAIALSAYGRNEDRARSLRAGFDRYFAKPFNPNEVISALRHLASMGKPS